jgi:hypothetical protein
MASVHQNLASAAVNRIHLHTAQYIVYIIYTTFQETSIPTAFLFNCFILAIY